MFFSHFYIFVLPWLVTVQITLLFFFCISTSFFSSRFNLLVSEQYNILVSSQFKVLVCPTGNALCSNCEFSAPDKDNTLTHCAETQKYSGWLEGICLPKPQVLLFEPMSTTPSRARWHPYSDELDFIAMKIRPDNFTGESSSVKAYW